MPTLTRPRELPQAGGEIHPQETKDPFTRLLDLTLGWAEYVERDEAEHGDSVKAADLNALYQSVAEFADPYWDAAPEIQEMAARHFIETRLLPLVLGKMK